MPVCRGLCQLLALPVPLCHLMRRLARSRLHGAGSYIHEDFTRQACEHPSWCMHSCAACLTQRR